MDKVLEARSRYLEIREELEKGNNLGEKITILGATKYVDIDTINAVIDCGLDHIGENKPQEFRDKFEQYHEVNKHLIGHLQSNKLKYVVGKADSIDSVNSYELARNINEFAKKLSLKQKVMIEINAGEEESKTGLGIEDAKKLSDSICTLDSIEVIGIMAMLPISEDEKLLSSLCIKVRDFYEELKKNNSSLTFLSLGMSSDYKIAVENGSNMVRLGTSIFGKRY